MYIIEFDFWHHFHQMLSRRLPASSLCGSTEATNSRPMSFKICKAYLNSYNLLLKLFLDIFTRYGDMDENAILQHLPEFK